MDPHPATAGKQHSQHDSPEQILDVFKVAALSVTKLFKTSIAAEARARSDGYQDCLDDLFAFLEKEGSTVGDPGLTKLRKWATDRRDGRDTGAQSSESDDEAYKPEPTPVPESSSSSNLVQMDTQSKRDASPAPVELVSVPAEPPHYVVPSQDAFTFQSDYQYPNISTLDLSDAMPHLGRNNTHSRISRARFNNNSNRSGPRSSLGRGAGSKRKMDYDDFFGGYLRSKDPYGGNGKRGRHS